MFERGQDYGILIFSYFCFLKSDRYSFTRECPLLTLAPRFSDAYIYTYYFISLDVILISVITVLACSFHGSPPCY